MHAIAAFEGGQQRPGRLRSEHLAAAQHPREPVHGRAVHDEQADGLGAAGLDRVDADVDEAGEEVGLRGGSGGSKGGKVNAVSVARSARAQVRALTERKTSSAFWLAACSSGGRPICGLEGLAGVGGEAWSGGANASWTRRYPSRKDVLNAAVHMTYGRLACVAGGCIESALDPLG